MWPCDQKVMELLSISHHSAKFGGHMYCGSSDISFFSFVSWQRNQKVTWVWRWGSSIPIYHSTQFGDHRYCKSADIIFTFATWPREQKVTYLVCGFSDRKLPLCQVWWPLVLILWKCRCKFFPFITWPCNKKVTWLWRWGFPTTSY